MSNEDKSTTSIREMTIGEILSLRASTQEQRDKTFLFYEPNKTNISYEKLYADALLFAYLLLGLGIKKGDTVGVMLDNSIEFIFIYFGTLQIGATIVPINTSLKSKAVYNVLRHSEAKILFIGIKNQDILREFPDLPHTLMKSILVDDHYFERIINDYSQLQIKKESTVLPHVFSSDVATILYTSGTTDQPKGVMLTHRNLVANAYDISNFLNLGNKRMLCVLPLHHTNGQVINVLAPLISGGSVVLCKAFDVFGLARFWEIVSAYGINVVDVVPTTLAMLQRLRTRGGQLNSSLEYIICGAAPLPIHLQQLFEDKFGCAVIQEYGLTEATCVSSMESVTNRKMGSVGHTLPGNQVKVVGANGQEAVPGDLGQILIKGDYVMQGYYKEPELTRAAMSDDWLDTGDIGIIDAEGFLHIRGRKKDVIIRIGENVYPIDVENIICGHPAVVECAVIGVPDEVYGEKIKAYVVLREKKLLSEKQLIAFCRERLPRLWCPSIVEFTNRLPKTASGKIIKRDLEKTRLNEGAKG